MAKIINVEYLGKQECFDLEVDHQDHQFYLSSGLLTSNSHSIAYSLNGYHTAYYKHYFPAAFLAAVLKSEVEGNSQSRDSNVRLYKKEAKRLGINIVSPHINNSSESYDVVDEKTISIGFRAIKGLGDSAVQNILKAREAGPFKNFADFLYRTESRFVRKDSIQALAKAGAFDSLGITRRAAFTYYQDIRQKINKHAPQQIQNGFEATDDFVFSRDDFEDEWDKKEILQAENEVLGEFVSGTINDVYDNFFTPSGTLFSRIKNMPDKYQVKIEAIVSDVTQNKLKNGKNKGKIYGRYSVSDSTGETINMTAWTEQFIKYKDKLEVGKPFKALCSINDWSGTKSLILISLF